VPWCPADGAVCRVIKAFGRKVLAGLDWVRSGDHRESLIGLPGKIWT